jgi:hypothetical protein
MFPFSSEEGVNLVRQVVQDLWPHVVGFVRRLEARKLNLTLRGIKE